MGRAWTGTTGTTGTTGATWSSEQAGARQLSDLNLGFELSSFNRVSWRGEALFRGLPLDSASV
jgi:hypothetical protein